MVARSAITPGAIPTKAEIPEFGTLLAALIKTRRAVAWFSFVFSRSETEIGLGESPGPHTNRAQSRGRRFSRRSGEPRTG
jgi:hypothetical protein